jgi:hypothetical protein
LLICLPPLGESICIKITVNLRVLFFAIESVFTLNLNKQNS